jgi:hypothetical protein
MYDKKWLRRTDQAEQLAEMMLKRERVLQQHSAARLRVSVVNRGGHDNLHRQHL